MEDKNDAGAPDTSGKAQGEQNPWALPTEPVPAPAQPMPVPIPASLPAQPAKPAQTPAKPAQPPVKPAPHSAPAGLTPSKMPDAQQLLDRLKEDILKKGGKWDDRWRVESKMRTSGNTAGTWDSYYFNPEGKRFRSRQEIMKMLGLDGDNKKLSREEAVKRAKALPRPELPLQLKDGIRVTKLGVIDASPTYHTATQLWPLGYEAENTGFEGCVLRSSVADGGAEGPLFNVTLVPSEAGHESAVLASERHPDSAWSKVAALQEAASAPTKAPKPKKPAQPPLVSTSADATPMETDSGDAAKGPATEVANGHVALLEEHGKQPKEATMPLGQPSIKDKLAAAAARPFKQPGAPALAPDQAAAKDKPDQATASAKPDQAPKALLLPTGQPIPDHIKVLLTRIAPLAGSWGMEQLGLVDVRVIKALEGLEGAEKCASYSFVEQRGSWAAESKRLEKEVLAHGKHKQRASKVAKKKDQEKADKAEKERAKQEAQMAKAMKRARDTEAKKSSVKASAHGDVAANGQEPSPKRKKLSQQPSSKAKGPAAEDMLALLHQEPSKRGPQTTQGVVARVMRRMLEQVERWAEKDAQKEERQRQKRLEKEAALKERLAQHQKVQEAVALAPQRLVDIEDSQLPGAHMQPPAPATVANGLLPTSTISDVVELWAFLGRFADLIGLERVPSIAELEADLTAPNGSRNITTSALMQLVQLVATEVFDSALGVAQDMDPDLLKVNLSGAQPSIREDTWPEVARRLFLLAGAAALVAAGDGSGGLDIALGPLLGSSPLSVLGPSMIFPGLVAGPSTTDPRLTPAALPLGACIKAPEAILARHDGQARAAAARRLADASAESKANADGDIIAADPEGITRTCRRILLQMTLVKGSKDASGEQSSGTVLCFEGASTAVAAKTAQPLDLMIVAARLDAGYYTAQGHGALDAFAADVTTVLENFKAAAKRSGLEIAARLAERKAADVAEAALVTLHSLLEEHRARQDSNTKGARGKAAKGKASSGDGEGELDEEDRRERTIVDDLSRPFVPWEGCAACWSNDDHRNILLCDGCDLEFHHYCVVPPLPDIPSGEWFCPACVRAASAAGHSGAESAQQPDLALQPAGQPVLAPHPAVQRNEFQRAAELLGAVEYADLSPVQRVEVARLLLSLASSSSLIRDELEQDAKNKKDLRRDLHDLRVKMKREAHEREEHDKAERAAREAAEAEKAKKAAAKGNAADKDGKGTKSSGGNEEIPAALLVDDSVKMTRAREAELAEAAKDAAREKDILEEIDTVGLPRCEALGFDRHWNRYWLLGAWEDNKGGAVYVERRHSGTPPREDVYEADVVGARTAEPEKVPGVGGVSWGCYGGGAAVDALIGYLNPVGLREGALRRALQRVRPNLAAEPTQPPTKPANANSGAAAAELSKPEQQEPAQPTKESAAEPGTDDAAKPTETEPESKDGTAADGQLEAKTAEQGAAENEAALPQDAGEPMEIDGRAEVTAVANKATDAGKAGTSAPAEAVDSRTAELRKLAGELMAFEEGPAADALDTGGAKWPYELRRRWRSLLEATTQPSEIMAALLVLEGALKPERLKPYWLLWAFPVPNPELAGTLPAVRLRLLALKSALKRGGGGAAAAHHAPKEAAAAPARQGRALRDRGRPAAVARLDAASAAATDESDADAPRHAARKRAAPHRPTARELADEELARKLQAEEDARASRRSDRASRLAAAAARSRRSTRSAAAVVDASSEDDSDSDAPRRRTRHAAKEAPVDPYRRTRGARAVLAEDQEVEDAPPRKTRAALQHLEAARKGRGAARKLDDFSEDEESSEESDRGENPATRVIEGRKRLRKRA
ncbi:probable lysine-specific demethylase 5A at C-terminar half [Coccomyxa sp. Obi]|nr:probable lysine-specific demethylase 5A at C-terminar half [Coccomyxa sp. Obi]